MKCLLAYLFIVLGLGLVVSVKADDIRDFQIEGRSIGDSALDYFSEEEIKQNIKNYYKNKKYTDSEIIGLPQFKQYHSVHINFKTNDKNYKIHALDDTVLFIENINDCYKKKDEIADEVSKIFTDAKKIDNKTRKHPYDKSGKSTVTDVQFDFKSGYIIVSCFDWSTKTGFTDHLRVTIKTKEYDIFLENEAYN